MERESKCRYEFQLQYKLDFKDSVLHIHLLGEEFEKYCAFKTPISDVLSVTVEDNSDVRMSYLKTIDDVKTSEVVEHQLLMSFFAKG